MGTYKNFEKKNSRYIQEFWKNSTKKTIFHHQLTKANCIKSNIIKNNKFINKNNLRIWKKHQKFCIYNLHM